LTKVKEIASEDLNISPRQLEILLRRVDRNMDEIMVLFELHSKRPTTYKKLLESVGRNGKDEAGE